MVLLDLLVSRSRFVLFVHTNWKASLLKKGSRSRKVKCLQITEIRAKLYIPSHFAYDVKLKHQGLRSLSVSHTHVHTYTHVRPSNDLSCVKLI